MGSDSAAAVAPGLNARAVPPRALAISAAALAVSVVGAVFFPEAVAEYSFLPWLLALVPAFLLCHYRRWTRILLVLAIAMVVLSAGYVLALAAGRQLADWPPIVLVIGTYIGLALGWGWFSEVRAEVRQREEAERQLREAYVDLRKSHADLQLAQWKLLETEKLEAVGQLAAGVAHEVKNPLMTLLTGVRYLSRRRPPADPDVAVLLEDMAEAVHRANTVITGLLDFSAPRELTLAPADLNDLVEKSVIMVKHELDRAHVTLRRELDPHTPRLPLDAMKVQQVLVNLLTNAAHASPAGGAITVRTRLTDEVLVSGAGPGDFATGRRLVVLEVDDTGSGIPEHQLGKLFDPFFTTKPAGKGTGLGLSVSRQIIDMHGATIDIRNRAEGGARATLIFDAPEGASDDRSD